ncbi:thermonuclease family protein [Xanthobacter sp. V2C-8]|uniref:thermonuclease family protein n=1 Tax=Xanthobacter albus TaxID=3119929 RepID=UPI00372B54E5
MRVLDTVLAFALLATLAAAVAWLERGTALSGAARAVDGDTLELDGRRIRLEGIDAPELHQTCGREDGGAAVSWPCGTAARTALAELARGGPLTCATRRNDAYGRALARCTTRSPGADTEIDLGAEMVRRGLAVSYGRHGYTAEEAQARAAGRGLWAGPFQQPRDFRAAHPRSG